MKKVILFIMLGMIASTQVAFAGLTGGPAPEITAFKQRCGGGIYDIPVKLYWPGCPVTVYANNVDFYANVFLDGQHVVSIPEYGETVNDVTGRLFVIPLNTTVGTHKLQVGYQITTPRLSVPVDFVVNMADAMHLPSFALEGEGLANLQKYADLSPEELAVQVAKYRVQQAADYERIAKITAARTASASAPALATTSTPALTATSSSSTAPTQEQINATAQMIKNMSGSGMGVGLSVPPAIPSLPMIPLSKVATRTPTISPQQRVDYMAQARAYLDTLRARTEQAQTSATSSASSTAATLRQIEATRAKLSAPAANAPITHFLHDLRSGMKDKKGKSEVYDLQQCLFDRSLLTAKPTGVFGKLTVSAVKAFQKSMGVKATGLVGPATRAKLNEYCEP